MKIKTKRYYTYYCAMMLGFIIALFPVRVGHWFAEVLGRAMFAFLKKEREKVLSNLKNAFPEKTGKEIEEIAKGVCVNICKNGVDLLNVYKFRKGNADNWITAENFDTLLELRAKNRGFIALASHFGNWEFLPIYSVFKGLKATVIARRIYFHKYDSIVHNLRTSKGIKVIFRNESPRKILLALKSGECLGILADQDVDSVDGVFVDFFGRQAYTPKAPVSIAMASGAPLIPCFLIREGHRHRFVVEKPIEIETKETKEETIRFNTQKWSRVLESYIRKYPSQWVWLHDRWKTKEEDVVKRS